MSENYYEVLGVDTGASQETIEQAYRERLKQTHPDVSDEENASERTKLLIEAKDVLTDKSERERYDSLGHETYVELEGSAVGSADTSETASDRKSASTSSAHATSTTGAQSTGTTSEGSSGGGTTSTGQRRKKRRHVRDNNETVSGTAAEDSWYSGTDGEGWENDEHSWRTRNTEGSFAVSRDGDRYQHGRLFVSQRSLILLGSTFVVYPVLLFGALFPEFPIAANLTVAMCIVLVIAFLQSVPEVGIAVFGIWSLLLPGVILWLGIELLSLYTLAAMVGVVFPLFLSVLTRLAVRPLSAG